MATVVANIVCCFPVGSFNFIKRLAIDSATQRIINSGWKHHMDSFFRRNPHNSCNYPDPFWVIHKTFLWHTSDDPGPKSNGCIA